MLTNFFSKSKPITILIVFGYFLGLLTLSFFNKNTQGLFIEIFFLFTFLFSLVIFINTKNNLSFDNLYVLLIFVLLTGIFPVVLKSNTIFYTNIILLFFLRKVYSLQSSSKTIQKLFDGGLWLGAAFIIEPFSLIFGFLIYFSIYLHQHLNFQKIIVPIIGFATTLLLFFTYCLWFDKSILFWKLFDWFTNYDLSLYLQNEFLIPTTTIAFISFLGIIIKTPKALSIKNDFRKSWILVLFNFICAAFLILVIKNRNGSELLYIFLPTAIIIANLIEIYEKKWFSSVLIALLICFSILMNFI